MCTTPGPGPEGCGPTPLPPVTEQEGPVSHAIVRVGRLHRILAGQLLRRVGLHPAQELVLMQLWDHGPQRQSDLARVLGADAATMTRTVKRLEQGGFVRRSPSPTDKRVTIVEATTASQGLKARVEQIWQELERSVVADLDQGERTTVLDVLGRMEQGLEQALRRARADQD